MELSDAVEVRVEYFHEGDLWWAHANLQFSAADEGLASLKQRVHAALEEVFGEVTYIEVVHDLLVPPLRNSA